MRRAGLFLFAARPVISRGPDVAKHLKQKRGTKTPMKKRASALDGLLSLSDDQVLDFHSWCQLNRISERTGRRILASSDGPRTVQISARRIGITVRANRNWQHARERAAR